MAAFLPCPLAGDRLDVETGGGRIAMTRTGSGPPLLCLHGFPQTRAMWHAVAPTLARTHTVIAPDLPGYGDSAAPAGPEGATKRKWAAQMIEMMAALGHERFAVASHDRGARVGYRLALDHPERVTRLAVIDILPTYEYWAKLNRAFALKIYHWAFLAQPPPFPETLIGGVPDFFLEEKLSSWTARGTLDCFDVDALAQYRRNVHDPVRLKAMCDDYRAGATFDVEHDAADREAGRRIGVPVLALWGAAGIAQNAATPLDVWREWCDSVEGEGIAGSGHFPCEENPADTAAALSRFFDQA